MGFSRLAKGEQNQLQLEGLLLPSRPPVGIVFRDRKSCASQTEYIYNFDIQFCSFNFSFNFNFNFILHCSDELILHREYNYNFLKEMYYSNIQILINGKSRKDAHRGQRS